MCRHCYDSGWIVRTLESAGYTRVPELDTRSRHGWVSPGQARCTTPKKKRIEVRQLCDCKRRAWNIPLIPVQVGARRPATRSPPQSFVM